VNSIVERLGGQFDISFKMLAALIDACPDSLWNEKAGGFYFWQQILHALCGSAFWLRLEGEGFAEPFSERRLFPELDGEPEGRVTKVEMRELADAVASQAQRFFAALPRASLDGPSPAFAGLSRLDVIEGQIRHLMYHVGHCDAALRDRGYACAPWLEFGAPAS